jgi:hypothetical protein
VTYVYEQSSFNSLCITLYSKCRYHVLFVLLNLLLFALCSCNSDTYNLRSDPGKLKLVTGPLPFLNTTGQQDNVCSGTILVVYLRFVRAKHRTFITRYPKVSLSLRHHWTSSKHLASLNEEFRYIVTVFRLAFLR